MSGRGRSINNMPAWMNNSDGNNGSHSHHNHNHNYSNGHGQRDRRDRERDHGPPPRHRDHDRGGLARHRDRGGSVPHSSGGRRGGPAPPQPPPPPPPGIIVFRSYEEEQAWVQERRRKRLMRPSKFDQGVQMGLGGTAIPINQALSEVGFVDPSLAAGASSTIDPADVAAAAAAALAAAAGPQQTRHARRLYIGNLPVAGVTEEQIHKEFRQAIERAYVPDPPQHPPLTEDPILSVYINHERRFCFLEFKTVEMTTACMLLDGYTLQGHALKIKRPNDYTEALAPRVHPSALPNLDVSRLGMISGTVLDGPNKIFIGGLHYNFTDAQVLELLQAFGPVKAFHLVKGNDPDASLSKGYCFIEYVNPDVTATAISGLNGMDIGGGKTLTARLAGERGAGMDGIGILAASPTSSTSPYAPSLATSTSIPQAGQPPPNKTIIHGYDIEALVDAAMGLCPMPTIPVFTDAMGIPITRIIPLALQQQHQQQQGHEQPLQATPNVHGEVSWEPGNSGFSAPSRVLVLHNMVQEDDLATADDHAALVEEIREECTKFGTLHEIIVPRDTTRTGTDPSAIGKVFLKYSSLDEAARATQELQGRKFGDATVQVTSLSEGDFDAGRLW